MADETFPVPAAFAKGAHIQGLEQYRKEYERSLADPAGFWAEQAKALDWFREPQRCSAPTSTRSTSSGSPAGG